MVGGLLIVGVGIILVIMAFHDSWRDGLLVLFPDLGKYV